MLLDFASHVAAAPLGYNDPEVMDRLREFDLVDPLKIAGQDFYVGDADPANVVDVRGKGLMLAVEFDTKSRRDTVLEAAVSYGLLTLPCGHRTFRILPPLDVTEREIALGADLLLDAVADAA